MELFLRLAAQGPIEGVTTLDLGQGAKPFKEKLANQHYSVKCGSVDLLPWRRKLYTWGRSARQQAKRLPWSKNMKRVIRRTSTALAPIRNL
jgi:CelD/BcsL family acetyltransferase involved in cellulose biosynthesis